MVYDLDWDENARVTSWRAAVESIENLPPLLAAAIALLAWEEIDPLQHKAWLGRLLVAAILRGRFRTLSHLLCVNTGLREIARDRRRARDSTTKLVAILDSFAEAAKLGMKAHDRWLLARGQLDRRLVGRRSNSSLPALADLVVARPILSAGLIARELKVTPRAAQDLVAELDLREMTGRGDIAPGGYCEADAPKSIGWVGAKSITQRNVSLSGPLASSASIAATEPR